MLNAQLVHALVDCRRCFVERGFKEFLMIVIAVMVCDRPGLVAPRGVAYVLKRTVHEREHVLGCRLIEHPPIRR